MQDFVPLTFFKRQSSDPAQSNREASQKADVIFVLAGREYRKKFALELFRQRVGLRLLLSVARFEVRQFSQLDLPQPVDLLTLASDVPPHQRHFFVLFEHRKCSVEHTPPGRFGTLTEITELARWLDRKPEILSVLVVSSDTHLRRVRLCCQSLLRQGLQLSLLAAPDISKAHRRSKSPSPVIIEAMKTVLYWVILRFRRNRQRGDRLNVTRSGPKC
jgi:hypothetical protein